MSLLAQGVGGDFMASASSSTPVPANSSTLPQQTKLPLAQSHALSTGAKAGIGAPVGMGALLVGTGIVLLCLRINEK